MLLLALYSVTSRGVRAGSQSQVRWTGCRNIIGVVRHDGTATIYAVTSTIRQNGDNGADPNQLVKVTDLISATQPATNGYLDRLVMIRSARGGEAFRGVALALEEEGR